MIVSLIRTVYFFCTQGRKYGRNLKLVMGELSEKIYVEQSFLATE